MVLVAFKFYAVYAFLKLTVHKQFYITELKLPLVPPSKRETCEVSKG